MLSIIVPSKDRALLLRRALTAIKAEQASDVEVIVVDDGSKDNTEQIVHEFPGTHYVRAAGGGVSAARNLGASRACGEWLLFLDDDDEIKPGSLHVILLRLTKRHNACVFYLEQVMPGGPSRVPRNQLLHDHTDVEDLMSLALRPISASQVAIRADTFRELAGFDESLYTCNDIDLWTRLLLADANIAVIQQVLVRKYEHSQTQLTRNLPKALRGHLVFLRKWRPVMKRRLDKLHYEKWYARRLEAIFPSHCGPGDQLALPLGFSASLHYCALWCRLLFLSDHAVRHLAARRVAASTLRAVLGRRGYAAISRRRWVTPLHSSMLI